MPFTPSSKPENTEHSPPSSRSVNNSAALNRSRDALGELLRDKKIPADVRRELQSEFDQLQAMLDKLEHGHIHIAVFGRVSVGKSALLNALLGEQRFSVSPLHGETRSASLAHWDSVSDGGLFLIDTPGINEIDGEKREQLAHDVAARSDLVLFVIDGDLTDTELQALRIIVEENRPVIVVLNKSDRFTPEQQKTLIAAVKNRLSGLIPGGHIVTAAANPAVKTYVRVNENGEEREEKRQPQPDVEAVRRLLWDILEREGKVLAALNATLFAGKLSDTVSKRIVELREDVANRLIHNYCTAKALAVAVNPVPLSDLVAAIAVDTSLVMHLSRVYGLPLTRKESGQLIGTIFRQVGLVMGAVWATHLVSSILKVSTFGISTLVTATAQGAVAYYATYIVGQSARQYFQRGKSWGAGGPKRVVNELLDSIDKESILQEAQEAIRSRLKNSN
ncbi:MAG: GTP-binding protein HSR1 [Gammaproteobacteria bacterium]|nr:MAG: GTP-binding protein HSR1 [Gammaproteobacteria bacterium]